MKSTSLKKLLLIGGTASAAILASIGYSTIDTSYAQESGIQYIDQTDEKSNDKKDINANDATGLKAEEKTQEEINAEEGISAEQIVVKITDDGYVTSHGDHYHYYNGKVPSDSILSETLLAPKDYQFNQADVVNDVEDGYIVKTGDTYYLYVKDPEKAKNIRTVDELVLQSYGIHPEDAANIVGLKKEYKLDEDSMITYELDRTPEEVSKETKNDEHIVVYLTEKEFVTLNGMDLYVFNKDIEDNAIFSEALLAPKDYKFNEKDVVKKFKGGSVVKIKGKLYVYLDNPNDTSRIKSLKEIETEVKKSIDEYKESGEKREDKNKTAAGAVLGIGGRDASGRLVAEDGYVFSPYDVLQDLGDGFIVPHGDHFHFIPKSQMTAGELAIAYQVLGGGGGSNLGSRPNTGAGNQGQGNHATNGTLLGTADQTNIDGSYTTDDGYVYSVDSIAEVYDFGLRTRHHDHFHFVPFKDLSLNELKATQKYIKDKFGINRDLVKEFFGSQDTPSANTPAIKPTQPTKPAQPTKEEKSEYQRKLEQLYNTPSNQRHTEGDGLVFDPATIIRRIQSGSEVMYVVPHGDHFHIISEKQLSPLEREVAELACKNKGIATTPSGNNKPAEPKKDNVKKDESKKNESKKEESKKDESKKDESKKEESKKNETKKDESKKNESKKDESKDHYTTDDGYVFTVESIVDVFDDAVNAKHDDHFHYIPFKDLNRQELEATQKYIKEKFGIDRDLVKEYFGETSKKNESKPVESKKDESKKDESKPVESKKEESKKDESKPAESKKDESKKDETKKDDKTLYEEKLKELESLPEDKRHREGDGLLFEPQLILKRVTSWGDVTSYVIAHGDHYHTIPSFKLTPLEYETAELFCKLQGWISETDQESGKANGEDTHEDHNDDDDITENDDTNNKDKVDFLNQGIEKTEKGKDGKPYTTDDGYTFSVESIASYGEDGLFTKHGDHMHYIPFADLDDDELKAAQDYINNADNHISEKEQSKFSKKEIEQKLTYISLSNAIPIDKLIVEGNDIIIPHGNHYHTASLDDTPISIRRSDFDSEDEYRSAILRLKIGYIRVKYNNVNDIARVNDKVIYYRVGKDNIETKLNDIKLPIEYDDIDLSNLVTSVDKDEEKLQYIADQYGVTRPNVRRLVGDIVLVYGKGAVSLSMVDVDAPIIYTLADKKPDETEKETADKDQSDKKDEKANDQDKKGDKKNEEKIVETEPKKEEVSDEVLMNFLAEYYNISRNNVSKMANGFIVHKDNAETRFITKAEVLAKYRGEAVDLPVLPDPEAEEVDEEKEVEKETTSDTPASRSTEEDAMPAADTPAVAEEPAPVVETPTEAPAETPADTPAPAADLAE